MESLYKQHILEHYKDPHNFGAVDEPDLEATVANETCGDELHFTATVEDGKVQELKFDGKGCALSIAAASVLSDELQDVAVERLKSISEEDVFVQLGLDRDRISPMRLKCVLLGRDCVQEMVSNNVTT